MPELPEVETVRRSLTPVLLGAVLADVEVRHPRMSRRQPRPRDLADRLRGRRVLAVGRRGKFLLTDLEEELLWVTHLGMSGRMQVAAPGDPEAPHTHVVVRTDGAAEIRMVDPRTFGFMAVLTPEELAGHPLQRLGPDALEELPTAAELERALEGRRAPIKALLLDQTLLAGLGNIYADEVLHRAGVRGSRPAGSLRPKEIEQLRAAIHPVLDEGVRMGGTSLNDLAYLLPDGRSGDYLPRLRVYGREGLACRQCGSPIRRTVIRQRSSFWCSKCQR